MAPQSETAENAAAKMVARAKMFFEVWQRDGGGLAEEHFQLSTTSRASQGGTPELCKKPARRKGMRQ